MTYAASVKPYYRCNVVLVLMLGRHNATAAQGVQGHRTQLLRRDPRGPPRPSSMRDKAGRSDEASNYRLWRPPAVPERTGRVAKRRICRIHQAIRERPLLAQSRRQVAKSNGHCRPPPWTSRLDGVLSSTRRRATASVRAERTFPGTFLSGPPGAGQIRDRRSAPDRRRKRAGLSRLHGFASAP